MEKKYPKLTNDNRDTFFSSDLGTFTVCEYDPDYFMWDDVVELAKENGYELKYITKSIDRNLYSKLNTCGFYTSIYVGIPCMINKDFEFDPAHLDV